MSDKSFEQQVREELSDLRMKPNAAVWESVAASLQKERKRRWALWLVVLLTAISGATFWWQTGETTKDTLASNILAPSDKKRDLDQIIDKSEKNGHSDNDTVKNRLVPSATEGIQQITASIKMKKNSHDFSSGNHKDKTESATVNKKADFEVIPQSVSSLVLKEKKEGEVEKSERNKVVQLAKEIQAYKQQEKDSIYKDTKKDDIPQTAAIVATQVSHPVKIHTDSSAENELAIKGKKNGIEEMTPVTSLVADSITKKDKIKKTGKWNWYIAVNAGTSGMRNSLRSLLEQSNARAYDNAFSGNGTINTPPVTGGMANPANTKPVVRDAFSFGSSVELMRKMGKKEKHAISFTAGYHLLTTRTGIGRSIIQDTVRFSNVNVTGDENKYYAVKDSARYTSYYHFIQFGARYYRTLTWFRKMDIQWYAGLSVNALISSNGLHLGSTGSSAYLFENRSLLRTLQMDITGGVDFRLGNAKQLLLGPQVQYILTNLSKQPGVNQHLFRPSVRLAFLLGKRK